MKTKPKKGGAKVKRVKAWAVIDGKPDVYWPQLNIGFYSVFPSASIAKNYRNEVNAEELEIVPCVVTYTVPINKRGN